MRKSLACAGSLMLGGLLLTPLLAATQTPATQTPPAQAPPAQAPPERSPTQGLKETDRFVKAGGQTTEAVTNAKMQMQKTLDTVQRSRDAAVKEHERRLQETDEVAGFDERSGGGGAQEGRRDAGGR